MDGRQFDALTRAFVGNSTRRRLLGRGAALTGALGSLATFGSASAARRGTSGTTSICSPDGSGGYFRTSVPNVLLPVYLNQGAIISDCCADADCGGSDSCSSSYCDFDAGACSVAYANGALCARPGCADGYCSGGLCVDPEPRTCLGDGFCNICQHDVCNDYCDCFVMPCYPDDWQCQDARCDPGQAACVLDPINEGGYCNTFGLDGVCMMGYCISE